MPRGYVLRRRFDMPGLIVEIEINRGVELTPDVADGANSVILDQVSNGLLIRMACLTLLTIERRRRKEAR